jgi:hypothetical protein
MQSYTVVLETTEPFGPEVQVMHEEAEGPRTAALRALCHWQSAEFNPNVEVEEIEDGSVRILRFLKDTATLLSPAIRLKSLRRAVPPAP